MWNPHYSNYIDQLENVQSKLCKYLYFKVYGLYSQSNFPQDQFYPKLILRLWIPEELMHNLYFWQNQSMVTLLAATFSIMYVPRFGSKNTLTFINEFARTPLYYNSTFFSMCTIYNNLHEEIDIFDYHMRVFTKKCNNQFL